MLIKMTVDDNSYHSLIKMTAKRTMKAQKYQVMPNKRSAAAYNLWQTNFESYNLWKKTNCEWDSETSLKSKWPIVWNESETSDVSDWSEMRGDSWTASNTKPQTPNIKHQTPNTKHQTPNTSETFSKWQDEETDMRWLPQTLNTWNNDDLPREIGKDLCPGAWWYTSQK